MLIAEALKSSGTIGAPVVEESSKDYGNVSERFAGAKGISSDMYFNRNQVLFIIICSHLLKNKEEFKIIYLVLMVHLVYQVMHSLIVHKHLVQMIILNQQIHIHHQQLIAQQLLKYQIIPILKLFLIVHMLLQ